MKERYGILDESKEKGITLDGKPALLGGVMLHFPIVATCDGAVRCEFSWAAVRRVLGKGGAFKSE